MAKNLVYCLWGEETYLIDRKVNEIIAEFKEQTGEEPEVVWVDADEMRAQELGQTLEYSPLFAIGRIVIIKKPSWLGKSSRKARQAEESLQVLQDYFQNDHEGQILIITALEHNASNPVTKFLDKNAHNINIKTLTPAELTSWCKEQFDSCGLKIAPAALNRISSSGQDMYYLVNLVEKLSLIWKSGEIGVKEIVEHLDSKQEITVFKLTDALLNLNLKAALAAFYQLQEQGQHHLLILHMISRQFLTLSKVKFYQEMGYSSSKIGELTAQKDFAVKKMMDKSSNFSSLQIRNIFTRLLETDISFKSESKDPRILMETLLIEMCSQK